ncbi:MAG: HTTM domain-containing protein, partial [Planctomycetota bacterium]|nr:HTTM domain-containing protein [Planctomycetota bacterium]
MTAGETLRKSFDDFWMKSGDLRILDPLRRAYGILLILNVSLLWLDRHRFFGTDSWVPIEMRRKIVDPDTFDLYSFFPGDPWVITLTLLVLALSGIGLILSFYPRILAALILFLLTSIHHANVMLFDSEDVVFRLFAFFLIFVPSWSKLKDATDTTPTKTTPTTSASRFPSWPRRLFQLQVCLIYLAAGIQKSNGEEWLDGSAIYYALRLDDMTLF